MAIPLYGIDTFKETLFDTLGWSDREWSLKVRDSSMAILFDLIETETGCGRPLIVEGTFHNEEDRPRLKKLMKENHFDVIELVCQAERECLISRFRARARSGDRHPGHRDEENLDEFLEGLRTVELKPLKLGKLIEVDTNDMEHIDLKKMFDEIEQAEEK